ncbi:hypothetical protein VOLCADRAFT_119765 [Volvox carteri f. nagariensis]|uniref:RWD domain-containing protein n=1 Tax=Volvox carteri f. nagariensis TaxID=3068 RepID=D8UGC1_VOLCA|nr:uncharacterized protein VOLCADRAFT_119765 [Volvox carteri f. nagariensis]EFJ41263.1 hypothetical protein VOLCADRAFT_119765 [Volvox carteri f. nagariensis]|eukprot:XP_002957714.1 hypothetical protein VOLCADRAFT_119765 [Volvox carteri f. nagariensis]
MGDDAIEVDAAAREEELLALEAIFGESVNVSREESLVEGGSQEVVLRASLPYDYPSLSCPVAVLYGNHLSDDVLSWAVKQMEAMFTPGEVVLYNWVEWLREQHDMLWAVPSVRQQAQKQQGQEGEGGGGTSRRAAQPQEAVREAEVMELLGALRVTSGVPYVEKKSTFQAHVAPVSSFEQVTAVMDALLSVSKIRAATHNIMAYRIHTVGPGGGAGTFLQDYDDDGEAAAGGRLLHLLQAADVRNVVVVVSRWFGGVLLGPARFTAINNTARELLETTGLLGGGGGGGKGGCKGARDTGRG